eukprot:gnl/Spiro4/9533_TR5051_c0_g2_i1.p1 gnl/Spiro4/9533_TR5051_c0_g2~~gnl/Spiro4/9533_TR5051_c0_g2_i1.p1  ORF type:complete len:274 (-),score=34.43 gnl/Spiro4/9533_TR5051_c0_g2_i1:31-852(-)
MRTNSSRALFTIGSKPAHRSGSNNPSGANTPRAVENLSRQASFKQPQDSSRRLGMQSQTSAPHLSSRMLAKSDSLLSLSMHSALQALPKLEGALSLSEDVPPPQAAYQGATDPRRAVRLAPGAFAGPPAQLTPRAHASLERVAGAERAAAPAPVSWRHKVKPEPIWTSPSPVPPPPSHAAVAAAETDVPAGRTPRTPRARLTSARSLRSCNSQMSSRSLGTDIQLRVRSAFEILLSIPPSDRHPRDVLQLVEFLRLCVTSRSVNFRNRFSANW